MKKLSKLLAFIMLINLICLSPFSAIAGKKKIKKTITAFTKPEIISTPDLDIPKVSVTKTSYKWLWVSLGAVVLGGAAAGSGGGSSDSGGVAAADDTETGSVNVSW
jgi:hypothetical protein